MRFLHTSDWHLGRTTQGRDFLAESAAVLADVTQLVILVDNDESGAGQAAAGECAQRWVAAGREVIRLMPKRQGSDFNDLVRP